MVQKFEIPTAVTAASGDLSDQSILVYGPPKIGKSTLAASFPDALFLPFEPGLNHLDHFQVPSEGIISSWKEFLQAAAVVAKGDHEFKTIVIDTVDLCYAICGEHICAQRGVEYTGDMGHGKGWTLVANEFMRVLKKLASLPYGLVLISHSKEKIVTEGGIERTVIRPSLTESARKALVGMVDMILYMDVDEVVDTNDPTKRKFRRVIRTRPTRQYEAGDRTGRMPAIVEIDVADPFANFAKAWSAGSTNTRPKTGRKTTRKVRQ